MKKLLLFLFLLFLWAGSSWGTTVQIGSGTSTSSVLPINAYYGYTYSQQIILASDIVAGGGDTGPINKIRFYFNSGPTATTNWVNWTIYIGNTTKTSFSSTTDWVAVGTLTSVFSGSIPAVAVGTWMEITLSTPFPYVAGNNIIVAVDENTPSYSASSVYWGSWIPGATSRSIYYYSDSTNPNPATPPTGSTTTAVSRIQFDMTAASCLPPTNLTATNITQTGAKLGWTAGGTETAWEYVIGVSPVAPPSGAGTATATNPTPVGGLLANTTYQYYVRSSCGGTFSGYAGPYTFKTLCDVGSVPFLENFDSYTIPAVGCWTVINANADAIYWYTTTTNPRSAPNCMFIGYNSSLAMNDWFISNGLPLTGGKSYTVDFYYRVYSASFPENLEVKWGDAPTVAGMTSSAIWTMSGIVNTSYALATCTFTPATNGTYYVGWHGFSAMDEDGIFVDDINIYETPTCPFPINLTATAITNNSANIGWTPGGTETAWEYAYGVAPYGPPVGAGTATTSNPTPLAGLSGNTTYNYYVRANCGTEFSTWTLAGTFTTDCDPVAAINENFDAVVSPVLPACWKKYTSPLWTSQYVQTYTSLPSSSPNCVILYSSGATIATEAPILISPRLSNLNSGTFQLTFDAKGSSTNTSIIVGTMSDPANPATFTAFQTVTGLSISAWTTYTLSFASYTGSDTYIAFRHPLTTTYYYVYVDNVAWELIPPCPKPTGLTALNITNNSADLGWTAGGSESTWEYVIGVSPVAPPTGSGTATNLNPVNVGGLLANTTYQYYVRAICGDPNGNSVWNGPFSFKTLCDPIGTFPWSENFDAMVTIGNNIVPDCWLVTSGSGTPWSSGNAASISYNDPCSAPNYVYVYYSPSATDKFLITPGFSLSAGTVYGFSFDWVGDNYAGWTATAMVNTTQSGTGATALGDPFLAAGTTAPTTCTNVMKTFSPTTSGTYYFMVKVNNTGVPWDLGFDNFGLAIIPTGTLQGTVTDCFNGYPLKNAPVTAGAYSTTTDNGGVYQFSALPVGTYTVDFSQTGYITKHDAGVSITEGAVTIKDECLNYNLAAPSGLVATVTYPNVHLTWLAPNSTPDQWIKWENTTSGGGVGWGSGSCNAVGASRWSVADIAPYSGMYLKKIRFVPYTGGSYATTGYSFTLKVYKGASSASLSEVYSQAVPTITFNVYNDVTLTTPVQIDGSQEFWFGFEAIAAQGYPFGIDAGPGIAGKGDMILSGGAWYSMVTDWALNYNFMIQGYVSGTSSKSPMLLPMTEQKTADIMLPASLPTPGNSTVKPTAALLDHPLHLETIEMNANSDLGDNIPPLGETGYNVYRNLTQLSNNQPDLFYDDLGLSPGSYTYDVTAVYPQGESPKISVTVQIYSCYWPTDVVVPNATLTTTSAVASWTPSTISPVTHWVVEYGPTGFAHGTGTVADVLTTPSYTMTPLLPGTVYDVYVRTVCTPGDSSLWVKKTFRTHYFNCPAGSVAELEVCGDTTNNGCNNVIPAFEPISCGTTVCGTAFFNGTTRDTDWYTFTIGETMDVTLTGAAEFSFLMGFIASPMSLQLHSFTRQHLWLVQQHP